MSSWPTTKCEESPPFVNANTLAAEAIVIHLKGWRKYAEKTHVFIIFVICLIDVDELWNYIPIFPSKSCTDLKQPDC